MNMKLFIFGKDSPQNLSLISKIMRETSLDVHYLGEKVDLSKIKPDDYNLIIILNKFIYNINFVKLLWDIKKDLSKPFLVINKLYTFGAIFFKKDFVIDKITTNKIYPFAGIVGIPKSLFKETVADILNNLDVENLRYVIIDNRRVS